MAEETGRRLCGFQKRIDQLEVHFKEAQGVVCQADRDAEDFLVKNLKKIFPPAHILAEESAFLIYGSKREGCIEFQKKEWAWVIDPLDGTHNFLNGLDYFAVCVALLHWGKPVVGCVYRPRERECFTAIEGEGSFVSRRGGRRKRIYASSNPKPLAHSLLVTGFATEKGMKREREFKIFRSIVEQCRGVRRMGSAALDLCFVAEGIFDAFWERGLAPWDVAAAGLICAEAGVKVTNYEGKKFHPFQSTILAARSPLHGRLTPSLS